MKSSTYREITRVRGVRLACVGEQQTGVPELASYEVPHEHEAFDIGELCPVSKLIGIPLLVSRVRPTLHYAATRASHGYRLAESYYPNVAAKSLMLCCDKALADLGDDARLLETPGRWQKNVGSVLVIRQDRKPLHAHHITVLLQCIAQVLGEDRTVAEGYFWPTVRVSTDEEVLRRFTPGYFRRFYEQRAESWKSAKEGSEERDLVDSPTPFTANLVDDGPSQRFQTRSESDVASPQEKAKSVNTWREVVTLDQLLNLKRRLGGFTESLVAQGPKGDGISK